MGGESALYEPSFSRILRIPHIVEDICLQHLPFWSHEGAIHEIGQEKKIKTRRQDLANMACVCKAFSSSALDVLWRNMDDFEDLLHVFPFYQDWGDRVSSSVFHLLDSCTYASYPSKRLSPKFHLINGNDSRRMHTVSAASDGRSCHLFR